MGGGAKEYREEGIEEGEREEAGCEWSGVKAFALVEVEELDYGVEEMSEPVCDG